MPKPMQRSRSLARRQRVTPKKRNVVHYERRAPSMPHCAICRAELNGISIRNAKGRTRKSNARAFGGVLCARCTGDVIKLASRIENGEMKLNEIGMRHREYVLQLMAH